MSALLYEGPVGDSVVQYIYACGSNIPKRAQSDQNKLESFELLHRSNK